ncbi:MAG TPA: GDSL-type esterase/lipase family protein, partial [Arenibacter sp.]|nr:GDSL-type esterase/lipase family protein [Arenibacter sp.]
LAVLGLILVCSFPQVQAQEYPFQSEISAFKKQDSLHKPIENPILFIGSSSFTNWTDVQDYFPQLAILNRAFGGSTLKDVIHYFDDIVIPYQPQQIVIYCGENDFAESDTVTSITVLSRFKTLHQLIRSRVGDLNIVFVSIKPSISRQHLMPKYIEGNRLIQDFLQEDKNAAFVNVYDAMLDDKGNPKSEIFLADNLHMNEKGYRIWQALMAPYMGSTKGR